ncbi:MAG: SPOR domain-containing protein [Gammaproteobacteria bacterium]|nr:SPOR domain-containing protein [Gammaproteobacteria bacterium]
MPELMDRALKERIIGAIVLVVFAVLVVPVFLDGPSRQDAQVAESITLPGQNGTATRTQRIVLNRDRSEPLPAAPSPGDPLETPQRETVEVPTDEPAAAPQRAAPAESGSAGTVEPVPQKVSTSAPTDDRAANVAAAPEPASETGMWAVQLGSFGNKQNADRLAANLRKSGYAAFLSKLESAGSSLHRVRVGPQKNRADAEAVAARLAAAGHKGQVVPHP